MATLGRFQLAIAFVPTTKPLPERNSGPVWNGPLLLSLGSLLPEGDRIPDLICNFLLRARSGLHLDNPSLLLCLINLHMIHLSVIRFLRLTAFN